MGITRRSLLKGFAALPALIGLRNVEASVAPPPKFDIAKDALRRMELMANKGSFAIDKTAMYPGAGPELLNGILASEVQINYAQDVRRTYLPSGKILYEGGDTHGTLLARHIILKTPLWDQLSSLRISREPVFDRKMRLMMQTAEGKELLYLMDGYYSSSFGSCATVGEITIVEAYMATFHRMQLDGVEPFPKTYRVEIDDPHDDGDYGYDYYDDYYDHGDSVS